MGKYIVAGNSYNNNVSLIIDVNSGKYFSKMLKIAETKEAIIKTTTRKIKRNENLKKVLKNYEVK